MISLHGLATMQPGGQLTAEVTAVSKRDLVPGDVLEGIGGRTHRAGCRIWEEARAEDALPIGLAKGCRVLETIPRGTLIRRQWVEMPGDSLICRLRREQDGGLDAAR
jgi:predicted homoserine dehydrogenase-like protein